MPSMGVCLSGDLCVDLEDTGARVAHARPVSRNLSSGGAPPEAPVAQPRWAARDLDYPAGVERGRLSPARDRRWKRTLRES